MWGFRALFTSGSRARAWMPVVALTMAMSGLSGAPAAGGTPDGTRELPAGRGPSLEALAEHALPAPPPTKAAATKSGFCWQASYPDAVGDVAGIDANASGIALDCVTKRWTYAIGTVSTWTTDDLFGVGLFIDRDQNESTGCYGIEHAILLLNFDGIEISATNTPSCTEDGADDGSWSPMSGPIEYFLDGANKLAALRFDHAAIKNPTSFRFYGVIDDWDTWDPDFLPEVGYHQVSGVPADLTQALPKAFDSGPRPTIDGVFDAVVAGDFNGDGRDDLFLYGSGKKGDGLKLGNADGTFRNGPKPVVDGTYDAVVAGDFNGDGRDDLFLYGAGKKGDALKLGKADGTFRNGPKPVVDGTFDAVVAGDFNGDGRDDLFLYGSGKKGDGLKLGNADGTFRNGPKPVVDGTYDAVVAGDFNGDDFGDVLGYGYRAGRDDLYYGAANSVFKTAAKVSRSGTFQPVAGDFNGDGRDDVVWYAPGTAADALSLGRAV